MRELELHALDKTIDLFSGQDREMFCVKEKKLMWTRKKIGVKAVMAICHKIHGTYIDMLI